MGKHPPGGPAPKKQRLRLSILIFSVGLLLSVALWDAYSNDTRPFDKEVASVLILIMGSLFSIAAGLFSWSMETRDTFLEKEVKARTYELNEKNKELVTKNEEIENFIHIISHDLKAPLVSIKGFAGMIKSELGDRLQGTVSDYFNRIQANVDQMNALILDLLELSRVGRVEEEKETVPLKDLLVEILAELRPEIEKRHIYVEVKDHYPPLWASRRRLAQVLTNLIHNAVKYMGLPETPKIEICCSETDSGDLCTLWVKDNGLGIKKEFHEKIFQIFQRAPTKQKIEGTGIGLSIVKKIVEHNGGKTWVESEEGKGSQFFVTWPKAEGIASVQTKAA